MRLTALTLRNFKSVGDRPVRIDFKPITLLFGPNSSGKSTVFQALHYLSEILEHYNCDPGHTGLGGSLDLGGFRNLVHQHDLNRSIHIRVEYYPDLPLASESFRYGLPLRTAEPLSLLGTEYPVTDEVSIELDIGWSHIDAKPFVRTYLVDIDGKRFGTCSGRQIAELNFSHPILKTSYDDENSELDNQDGHAYQTRLEAFVRNRTIGFTSDTPSLPNLDHPLYISLNSTDPDESIYENEDDDDDDDAEKWIGIMRVLTQGFVTSLRLLRDFLREMIYLGPLREVPTRYYQPERSANLSRWASGLAAWDILHRSKQSFVDRVNSWLVAKDRLNTGYSVRLSQFKEIEIGSRLMLELTKSSSPEDFGWIHGQIASLPIFSKLTLWDDTNNLELSAQDVGIGISQLLPIVVAALHSREGIVSIEQPELHVHPALQTAMGDLFIERLPGRAKKRVEDSLAFQVVEVNQQEEEDWQKQAMFLIETHSEHLMLRFLRRIRETHDQELPPGALPLWPDDLAVYYVEPGQDGVITKHLRIDETGEFIDRWPRGFFEERAEELF